MAKFRYQTVDDYGNYDKGILEAQSYQLAMEQLKSDNVWIIQLFDLNSSILTRDLSFGGPKVKIEHFTVFCRQLSTLYKSGITMVEAVKVLAEQAEGKAFKKVLGEITDEMRRGTQFSIAVAKYPTVFSTIFINMIRAGEASGNLDEMLSRLALFYEKEHATREKVKSAMIYPMIMGVVTIAVVTLMMTFVIPKFVANFEAMGMELPLPTRIIIMISDWMKSYWYLIPVLAMLLWLIITMMKKTAIGLYYWDYIRLKIPVFGKLSHKQSIARFSRTFSSLYGAAIPMLQTMSIVSSVVGNEVIRRLILESREGLKSGQSIAEPFRNSWIFPPMVVQMLAIGERSGALDTMMEKVADFYEADVDTMSDRLKSLLEPLMILTLSGIVGGIVMAIMMPTFKMMQNLG